MVGNELPENILHFLDTRLDSVEQLQVLFLLHAEPERIWSTAEITAELRSSDTSITKRLDDLYASKVLVRMPELQGRHRFSPASPEILQIVHLLAELYRTKPSRVSEAIFSGPNKSLQAFANAFRRNGAKE